MFKLTPDRNNTHSCVSDKYKRGCTAGLEFVM